MSGSYTDTRALEQDFFKDIIDRTNNDLIDVSQAAEGVTELDAAERSSRYQEIIRSVQVQGMTLPIPSRRSGLYCVDERDRVRARAVEIAEKAKAEWNAVKVKSAGDVVVPLPA
jgi:hypothetical protein